MTRRAWAMMFGLAVLGACSSFQVAEAPPGTDAGVDGGSPDAPIGTLDASATGPLGCRAPRAPGCDPATSCVVLPLSGAPNEPEFTFGITTDSASVYWVAQHTGEGDAYNGHADATIFAIDKRGGARRTLATAQREATTIAVDGDSVYWVALKTEPPTAWELRRVARDCGGDGSAACDVDAVVASVSDVAVTEVHVVAPGRLAVLTGGGQVRLVETATLGVSTPADTGARPGLATTPSAVFASSPFELNVVQVDVASGVASSLPAIPASGNESGPRFLATDCRDVFALRDGNDARDLFRFRNGAPTLLARMDRTFDPQALAADEGYVYAAGKFGLYVVDTLKETALLRSYPEIWRVAVDDEGVYYGDHVTGAIYMLRK